MRKLNHMLILAILSSIICLFQNKLVIARMIHIHEVDLSQNHVKKLWVEYVQKSYATDLKQLEDVLRKCGINVKIVRAHFEKTIKSSSKLTQDILLTLLTNNNEDLSHCFRKYHPFYHYSRQRARPALLLHHNSTPRRSLLQKSLKESISSSDSTLDDSIIIPPQLLYQSPILPEVNPRSSSVIPKEENNKELIIIIVISGTIAGISAILALLVCCYLVIGSRGFEDKQRNDNSLLTVSSSDNLVGSQMNESNDIERSTFASRTNQPTIDVPLDKVLASIPENDMDIVDNVDTLNHRKFSPKESNVSPPSPPPAPAFKPKAPPPPPKITRPPPAPPLEFSKLPHQHGRSTLGDETEFTSKSNAQRTKLKPFFWDKVVGNTDHSMIWDEIRGGSFQFNEQKMESLFGYNPNDRGNMERRGQASDVSQPQQIQIIDPKKSQNLSILLKALNVTTEEVCDALFEGDDLPTELLHTMLRMAPTQEEELKLRLFDGDLSLLGPAQRFLKVLVDIPLAFKKIESLMFMATYKEEVSNIKESFVTLEVACDALKKTRLFHKLLEAVLKTGNRMNDGTYRGDAHAFKLDTLLKLADVKGTDGKTTLLHFVVQEISNSEGLKVLRSRKENHNESGDIFKEIDFDETEKYRTLGLDIVSRISSDLENVKKAAAVDADGLTTAVSKLGQSLTKIKNFLNHEMGNVEKETGFYSTLVSFRNHSESEVEWMVKEERRISELVRKTADYFHGNAGREEGLRLFSIVRDFLVMLDRICSQLKQSISQPVRNFDSISKGTSPKNSYETFIYRELKL